MAMRLSKGSSSRVILAVLYTSLLWFVLDVLILAMYSSISEEDGRSTFKLPVNTENQHRDIREEDFSVLSGEPGDVGDSLRDFMLKKRAKNDADAHHQQQREKQSRFSWGKKLKDNLQHSNQTKNDVEDEMILIEEQNEMKKEIERLKKELSDFRGQDAVGGARRNEDVKDNLRSMDQKLRQSISQYNETKIRVVEDSRGNIDNIIQKSGKHVIQNVDVTSQPRDPKGPGEMGAPVRTRPEDEAAVKAGWEHAFFNEFVSDRISVERSIKDPRPQACKKAEYSNDLPRTSVIICFTEESWSPLLRTVHSVINRTPPELLAEVILVDDFSQRDYLKQPLDEYMSRLPKVKILRLAKREGLIRARILGTEIAQGPVLTFLDSHVECNVGWIEPLLQRIHDNKSNVVCPAIDAIDARTFQYSASGNGIIGSFNWEMRFIWNAIPSYESDRRKDQSWPIRSPAMAGGLFSIHKDYFYKLGTYDPGFDIWGAENLELSFKIWMCGGSLEILPCSRVGHIFRKQQPYKFPEGNQKTFLRNTQRLVEVWVDQPYRNIFYAHRPSLIGHDFGDVSDRVQLREDLKCHSFKWFLDNVFPALDIPDTKVQARGEVRNLGINMCLDSMGKGMLGLYPCHGEGEHQNFLLTWQDTLKSDTRCLTRVGSGQLAMRSCGTPSNLHFRHIHGQVLQDESTQKCLDVNADKTMAVFHHCDGQSTQRWKFGFYYDRDGFILPQK